MQPASRTPEGEPNRCPVCGKEVRLEPSRPPGDAPCPNCGHLLWFFSPVGPATCSIDPPEYTVRAWTNHVALAPDNQYFKELISELAKFTAAKRGAIWILAGTQLKRKADYQEAEFPETMSDRERGNELLRRVAASGQSLVSQPIEGCCLNKDTPETSDSLLLAVPVKRNSTTVAIIELAQEAGAAIELQRSNLRFLEQIGRLAGERIGQLADADSAADTTLAPEGMAESISKKHWWQVWKK